MLQALVDVGSACEASGLSLHPSRNQECKAGACTVHGKAAFAISAAEMS